MNKNENTQGCATRAEVYAAIDSERAYQERMWSEHTAADPRPLSIGEFVLMLEHYHGLALSELNVLEPMRKIAGITVQCLEHHGGSTHGNPSTLTRGQVYELIDQELEALVSPAAKPSIAWELANIRHLLYQARASWATERRPELGALYRLREIAAIAVRCLENHGAPRRQ